VSASKAGGLRATRRAQGVLGLVLLLPTALLTIVFFLFPLVSAVYYSFVDFHGFEDNPEFVGFANYQRMFEDPEMWHSLSNNLTWIVIGTISPLVIGLLLAMLQWSLRRSAVIYRLAFFLPYVLPGVVIGIVWKWIYDPINGWLNRVLEMIGLGQFTRGWIGDPDTALYAVLATAVWAATGFVMVIFLSALRNVDVELVEAATLDGANAAQRLWHIILPQIMPVFLMVATVTLVGGFSVFDIVFIVTGGGPANATSVLGTYSYKNAFQLNDISYGTTLALLITALSVPCAVVINRLQRRFSVTETGA
jgi:ABC-type sugar transport system permease subunit